MIVRSRAKALLVAVIGMAAISLGSGFAHADPSEPKPGCGFTSELPWSPCAETPPWGTRYPGGYDWTGKEPGHWGPGGYHYCDYREGCGG